MRMSPMAASQHNKRTGGHLAHAAQPRQDAPVTQTIYLNAPTGGTSPSNSAQKLPIAAIAGGLAAGVAMVVAAVLLWRCCGRIGRRSTQDDRRRAGAGRRPTAGDSFKRISWRPEDSFSASAQKKGPLPLSPASPTGKFPPVMNVELRTSNASSSDGGGGRGSREDRDERRYHKSDEGGYVGPADLGYSSPPASPTTEKESSSRRSPKSHKPPARRVTNPDLEPTPNPSSPTERARPWAPARPSPLAQASLRASAASPAPSHTGVPSQYEPTPPSPFSPPPGSSADPFLDPVHPPQHFAYADEEYGHDPESGGIGYAI